MALVALRTDGHIATITLAPAEGAYGRAFMDALAEAARQVAAAADVRAVVLRSDGDFGTGWAVEGVGGPAPGEGIEAIAAIPQPVVAAIGGRCHSAGLELALAADIRIAADDTNVAMPDTLGGAVPRGGGTQRLPRAVGRAHALRLLLTGEAIDAAEARRIGLVSAVVPRSELDAAAAVLAGQIAERGPLATRFAKEAVRRGVELPLDQALRMELDLTVLLQATDDRAEGVRAFVEKRPPRFTGR